MAPLPSMKVEKTSFTLAGKTFAEPVMNDDLYSSMLGMSHLVSSSWIRVCDVSFTASMSNEQTSIPAAQVGKFGKAQLSTKQIITG